MSDWSYWDVNKYTSTGWGGDCQPYCETAECTDRSLSDDSPLQLHRHWSQQDWQPRPQQHPAEGSPWQHGQQEDKTKTTITIQSLLSKGCDLSHTTSCVAFSCSTVPHPAGPPPPSPKSEGPGSNSPEWSGGGGAGTGTRGLESALRCQRRRDECWSSVERSPEDRSAASCLHTPHWPCRERQEPSDKPPTAGW